MSLLDPQNPIPPSTLTADDYATAAATLGCELAIIQAVTAIEAPDGPFDSQGRPTILFEPRVFSSLTSHQYDADYPAISTVGPVTYGALSDQYPKLATACSLDLDSGLKAASWGMFQLLGINFSACGFQDVEMMVAAMRTGDTAHLQAFVAFIQSEPALVTAIQAKDWVTFSIHYNGPAEKVNGYDTKLAAAYQNITGGATQ